MVDTAPRGLLALRAAAMATAAAPWPPWIIALACVVGVLIVAFVLGKCKAYRAQAWLCNIAVIAPVNVVVVVLYYLLTPLRWCYSRTCNCCTTPMISLCEIHPSWKNSTFSSFMDAVVIGYKGCFGLTPDAPKPMPSILDMDQAEAAGYFQKLFKMKLFTCCAQYLDACCPMACRESLCCRVCTAYCSGVFCGWWLVGTIWVQPLRAPAAPAPADAEAADADGGGDEESGGPLVAAGAPAAMEMLGRPLLSADDAADAAAVDTPTVVIHGDDAGCSPAPAGKPAGVDVTLYFKDCRFLRAARDKYGEDKGTRACQNE